MPTLLRFTPYLAFIVLVAVSATFTASSQDYGGSGGYGGTGGYSSSSQTSSSSSSSSNCIQAALSDTGIPDVGEWEELSDDVDYFDNRTVKTGIVTVDGTWITYLEKKVTSSSDFSEQRIPNDQINAEERARTGDGKTRPEYKCKGVDRERIDYIEKKMPFNGPQCEWDSTDSWMDWDEYRFFDFHIVAGENPNTPLNWPEGEATTDYSPLKYWDNFNVKGEFRMANQPPYISIWKSHEFYPPYVPYKQGLKRGITSEDMPNPDPNGRNIRDLYIARPSPGSDGSCSYDLDRLGYYIDEWRGFCEYPPTHPNAVKAGLVMSKMGQPSLPSTCADGFADFISDVNTDIYPGD